MAKEKDFPMEHYKQLIERNKELVKKNERLTIDNMKKDRQIQKRDEFIQKQNFALIREQNNVSELSETATDAQSKGASILKQFSDTFRRITTNEE